MTTALNDAVTGVAALLMAHLLTPFGRCLCGFEVGGGMDSVEGEHEWSVHVAEAITRERRLHGLVWTLGTNDYY